jgi:alkylhydroperoxidase family enzyme
MSAAKKCAPSPVPRIPLLQDSEIPPGPCVDAILARRKGQLIALDRLLLHSAPVAEGWNQMMGKLRQDLALDPMLRELAMCAVAVLNDAAYELYHHAPLYVQHGGTQAQLEALAGLDAPEESPLFDDAQRAVLKMARESTRGVHISQETFTAVTIALGSDRSVLELLVVIAAYNMVSRILVGAGLHQES